MKNMGSITGIFLCIVLMASCSPVTSVTPLSPPETAQQDERLMGIWALWDPKDEGYNDPEGWVHLLAADSGITDIYLFIDQELGRYTMHPTISGSFTYMNLKPSYLSDEYCIKKSCLEEAEEFGYLIMKYEIAGNTLKLWEMGPGIGKAIKEGELKGKIVLDDIKITDTAENIIKYLEKTNHGKIFKEFAQLTKAKLVPSNFGTRTEEVHETDEETRQPPFKSN